MKKFFKFIAILSVMSLFLSIPVSAATLSATGTTFTSAWELYKTSPDGKASLTYGYNTFAVKEDISWANHSTLNHYASLTNGNGSFSGPNKGAGSLSKIEVTHKGGTVTYYCNY